MKHVKAKQSAALATQFLQTVKTKKAHQAREQSRRATTAIRLRAHIKHWRKNYPSAYGAFTDIRRHTQCISCYSIQQQSRSAETKIQLLSIEISNQKHLAQNLQEAKSQLLLMNSQTENMSRKIVKQDRKIKSQKALIHTLKETIDALTMENATLKWAHGQKFSKGKRHKQMWTSWPGKDIMTEGVIMYPSPSIIDEIKKMKDTHVTQKYVDLNGEARRLPIIKLKSNMYIAIRRQLSKRLRIHRIYTQGQGTKVDWIAIPKNQ